jgi:hypothetical protein
MLPNGMFEIFIMNLKEKILSMQKMRGVEQKEWEWASAYSQKSHSERLTLLRPIQYEITTPVEAPVASTHKRKALSLNISSGGMLVLMDHVPDLNQVMKVCVPTPVSLVETPTLAEVRWSRQVSFWQGDETEPYLVGLKFLF